MVDQGSPKPLMGVRFPPALPNHMKQIVLLVLLLIVGLLVWFRIQPLYFPFSYRLDYAEGSCSTSSQCKWAGDACGGGHGVCTNHPSKYDRMASICDINNKFPANEGYRCTCILSQQKCGWVK